VNAERPATKRLLGVADMWRADGPERHADFLEELAAEVERLQGERDSLWLELQASEHQRKRDNEYLLGERDRLAEALRPFADAHAHRTTKGMKTRPPSLGPKELQAAWEALVGEPGGPDS
jgi:hypothetical protein